MARKKAPWRVLFSAGADRKSEPDGVIILDVRYEERTVVLYPYESREDALLGAEKQADNRAFLTREGVAAIVDELGGAEVYGRYLSGKETVSYIVSCREKYQGEELLKRIRSLVSTIGHKAKAVDLSVLTSAAKQSLKYVTHDLSAFRMLGLMGELNDILNFTFRWGE